MSPLLALATLSAAGWLGLALRLAWRRRQAPPLPPPVAVSEVPPTTILLPVRDEEENLPACAATLLAQRGASALRVVDDGSTDRTPAILADLARLFPQVAALSAPPLAAGWGGKVNALAAGFDGVATEWILLTDADTRHHPELLARAHAAAAEHRLDALSLAGRQETFGLGEALLTPTVYALLDLMLGDWRPYARGEGAAAVANGQYFLLRSAALRSIGGFAAIAHDSLDDVALARALVAGGKRVGFRRAGGALEVRMYRGLAATFRGWRRNLALFVASQRTAAALAIVLPLFTITLMALSIRARDLPALSTCWLGGATAAGLARRGSGSHPFAGAFFPLDVLLLAGTMALAIFDRARGRTARWRGREVAVRRKR